MTAPLPVDQVPGRRVGLVTTWVKAGTERRRVTKSDRPNIVEKRSAATKLRVRKQESRDAGAEGGERLRGDDGWNQEEQRWGSIPTPFLHLHVTGTEV